MPTSIVTITQYTPDPPIQVATDSALEVRGWYSADFVAGDGATPVYGNDTNGEQGPYYPIDASQNGDGNLVVAAHDVQATTLSNPTARYFEGLWIDGAFSGLLIPNTAGASGWQIPTVGGFTITFANLALYNRARRLVYAPDTWFTADETITAIRQYAGDFDYAAVGVNGITSMDVAPSVASLPVAVGANSYATTTHLGISKLSVAPASATSPIAVGDNDPRLSGLPVADASSSVKGITRLSTNPVLATAPIAYGVNDLKQPASSDPVFWASQYSSFNAAISAIGSTVATLIISQNITLITTCTVPSTLTLQFMGAGAITLVDANTVTIQGNIIAPVKQIFGNATAGHGTISFSGNLSVTTVIPQWWGAIADGTTDVTIHISAAIAAFNTTPNGGILYFRAGVYKTTTTLTTITANGRMIGDGMLGAGTGASRINFTSSSTNAFNIASPVFSVESLILINTAGSTPTAGYGFNVTGSGVYQKVDFESVYVYRFYHDIHQAGAFWKMHGCSIVASVSSQIDIENTFNPDAGDWTIEACNFEADGTFPPLTIKVISSGGGKIINNKILGTEIAIEALNASTSILIITANSIEHFTSTGIVIVGDYSTSNWANIVITGNEMMADPANTTHNGIELVGVRNATITGNVPVNGGSGVAFIVLETHCENVRLDNNGIGTFGRLVQTDGTYTGAPLASQAASALSIASNAITPEYEIFHLGAGLLKTINGTSTTETFTYTVIPDAAFTYDATGNIVVPSGGGTAVIGRPMQFVCYRNGSCYPSY